MGSEEHMQIGVVAELTEVSIQTLRHWEKAGLVEPSARSAGGFRLYTSDDVERLRTIRRMKPLGFTLEAMKALLDALDTLRSPEVDPRAAQEARAVLQDLATQVEDSTARLQRHLDYAHELRARLAREQESAGS
ncbi:MerR family transcriptional regulator [Auraticoccus monumenti]|uniref:DNA-binding transcriptional regulator, MerR family n=1 Tax=Auraticoccus monumenti TaxID=675864 RepID=A0A1G6VPE3_9ACTN|nr:MerR family transcriptional regulator [Auraticoccus monumenti]SDD55293.1 DNA-binding transcriptional regulator, MerR family [Auraticoccus monumenti]